MFTFLAQRKQTKIKSLQDPNKNNVGNLNNVTCEASTHFRNQTKEYPKAKIDELQTNSKLKNIRDLYRVINDFEEGFQLRI